MADREKTVYNSRSVRLSQELLADLKRGRFAAGELLPPERDLAELYQVSRSTVRRAVEMLVAANQLSKQPQRGVVVPSAVVEANGAAARQVALITLALSSEAEEHVLGLQESLETSGFTLGVYCSQSNPVRFSQLLEHLIVMRPAGIILQGAELYQEMPKHDRLTQALTASGIPMVRLDSADRLPVAADHVRGAPYHVGQVAARYLVAKNYRDLTFLSVCPENDHAELVTGLRHLLTPAGIALPDERVIHFPSPHGLGPAPDPCIDAEKKMQEWLAGGFCRGTILADHDFPATGILRAVLAAGLKVPEEVQVISLLRCHVNGAQPLRLTTIESHRAERGYLAGCQLLRRIAGYAGPVEILRVATDELVPGETG